MLMSNQTAKAPQILTELPGPNASRMIESDERYTSPSYTRFYPLAVERGEGAVIEDVDGLGIHFSTLMHFGLCLEIPPGHDSVFHPKIATVSPPAERNDGGFKERIFGVRSPLLIEANPWRKP